MYAQPFFHRDSAIAIENAEYGISRLKEGHREYVFYLRGTLAALCSVRDYLLEEHNKKFKLAFPDDKMLDINRFREQAKVTKNAKALEFIDVFDKMWKDMLSDPKVNAILGPKGERNRTIHRGPSLLEASTLILTPDQRYELYGEPTQHFYDPKKKEPLKETVTNSCSYCLLKLQEFRAYFVFVFK